MEQLCSLQEEQEEVEQRGRAGGSGTVDGATQPAGGTAVGGSACVAATPDSKFQTSVPRAQMGPRKKVAGSPKVVVINVVNQVLWYGNQAHALYMRIMSNI